MKQKLILTSSLLSIALIILFSCGKKSNDGISPGYKDEQGTGGNPNSHNQTVTGAATSTNPATKNSVINNVGGTGWSNPTCGSTGSLSLRGESGSTKVTISFYSSPSTGTYVTGPAPTANGACAITVENAPNQPAGIIWYAKSGATVMVSKTASNINASFSNIVCYQASFNFPSVTISGAVGCNQ